MRAESGMRWPRPVSARRCCRPQNGLPRHAVGPPLGSGGYCSRGRRSPWSPSPAGEVAQALDRHLDVAQQHAYRSTAADCVEDREVVRTTFDRGGQLQHKAGSLGRPSVASQRRHPRYRRRLGRPCGAPAADALRDGFVAVRATTGDVCPYSAVTRRLSLSRHQSPSSDGGSCSIADKDAGSRRWSCCGTSPQFPARCWTAVPQGRRASGDARQGSKSYVYGCSLPPVRLATSGPGKCTWLVP